MTVVAALPSEETIQKAQKTLCLCRDQRTIFTSIRAQIRSQQRDCFPLPTPPPNLSFFKWAIQCRFLQQLLCTVICREHHYFRKAEFAASLLTIPPTHHIKDLVILHVTKSPVLQECAGDVQYIHMTKLQTHANKHLTNKLNSNKAPGNVINFVQQ